MFEIHLTVQTNDVEKFREDCKRANVKPVVIELQNRQTAETVQMDVMTSSKFKGGHSGREVVKLAQKFGEMGYNVLRKKIEIDPGFYGIREVSGNKYFESHVRILINKNSEGKLRSLCEKNDFHLSRNIFKKADGENYFIMATLRMYDATVEKFKAKIADFLYNIRDFKYDKIEVECCVYDSNIKHDHSWIK